MSSAAGNFATWAQIGTALASAYAPTKAATSMVGVHYAMTLKPEGFKVTNVHPGYVRTDMGGPDAYIAIDESIDGLYVPSPSSESLLLTVKCQGLRKRQGGGCTCPLQLRWYCSSVVNSPRSLCS